MSHPVHTDTPTTPQRPVPSVDEAATGTPEPSSATRAALVRLAAVLTGPKPTSTQTPRKKKEKENDKKKDHRQRLRGDRGGSPPASVVGEAGRRVGVGAVVGLRMTGGYLYAGEHADLVPARGTGDKAARKEAIQSLRSERWKRLGICLGAGAGVAAGPALLADGAHWALYTLYVLYPLPLWMIGTHHVEQRAAGDGAVPVTSAEPVAEVTAAPTPADFVALDHEPAQGTTALTTPVPPPDVVVPTSAQLAESIASIDGVGRVGDITVTTRPTALPEGEGGWQAKVFLTRSTAGRLQAEAARLASALDVAAPWQIRVRPVGASGLRADITCRVETEQEREVEARVLGATRDENRIIARLDEWPTHAKSRGLDGIVPGQPTLDESGICSMLALGGKWTPARIRGATDQVRALLAIPDGAGVQIAPGATGDQAQLRIRTRTPDLDTRWHAERRGIGVVPETGRIVDVDPYGHRLVAGTTGAGKSVGMRPWMARIVLNPVGALVFVDPKGQEYHLWEHCARSVKGVGDDGRDWMYSVIREVAAELEWRQDTSTGTTWTPTPQHPELVLVIDEGAAIVRMAKTKVFDPELKREVRPYADVLDKLEYISTQGRAGRVWLHWATQYPTKADGIPAQVTEMMTTRMSLRLDSPTADRVIFGENATATGWTPSELDMPGWAMLRTGPKDAPEHILQWHMTDDQVQQLPAREPWHHDSGEDEEEDDWIGAQGAILATLREHGPHTLPQLDDGLDYSRSMIHKTIRDLADAGRVEQVGGRGSAWRLL